ISMHVGSTVHDESLAGDEVAVGRSEEGNRPYQVLGLLHALERTGGSRRLAVLHDGVVWIFLRQRAAGGDAIDADVVLAHFHGERAREAEDRSEEHTSEL